MMVLHDSYKHLDCSVHSSLVKSSRISFWWLWKCAYPLGKCRNVWFWTQSDSFWTTLGKSCEFYEPYLNTKYLQKKVLYFFQNEFTLENTHFGGPQRSFLSTWTIAYSSWNSKSYWWAEKNKIFCEGYVDFWFIFGSKKYVFWTFLIFGDPFLILRGYRWF